MKFQNSLNETGKAKIRAAIEAGDASALLGGKTAKQQAMIISSACAMIWGEGESQVGGWYDVAGDLIEKVRKYGEEARPLSEKQLDWVSRELTSLFRNQKGF